MPRSPRDYRAEYAARLQRARGLPTLVARGHGPVPIRVARGVEAQIAGKPRALPVKTQIRYREGIGTYEKRFSGGLKTGHAINLVFPSKRSAELYLTTYLDISPESEYVEIEGGGSEWMITLLR